MILLPTTSVLYLFDLTYYSLINFTPSLCHQTHFYEVKNDDTRWEIGDDDEEEVEVWETDEDDDDDDDDDDDVLSLDKFADLLIVD